jgi:hypothetical protein
MIDLSKLLKYEYAEVVGTVKNNEDEHKQSRIQIEIPGFNNNTEASALEWVEKHTASIDNTLDIPNVGDLVYVVATHGELRWRHMDFIEQDVINTFVNNDDYLKSLVLTYKNLDKFRSAGHLFIGWTDTDGFRIVKDQAIFQLRKDNSIVLFNGNQTIHVNENRISLGSENQSAEPGVMGDQNEIALNMLNDTIKSLAQLTDNMMTKLAAKASTSPYTAHLSPDIRQFGSNFKERALSAHADNSAHFPKTKSKIISVD